MTGDQVHRKIVEKNRQMMELGFELINLTDGWKCPHCEFKTEYVTRAKNHRKQHPQITNWIK